MIIYIMPIFPYNIMMFYLQEELYEQAYRNYSIMVDQKKLNLLFCWIEEVENYLYNQIFQLYPTMYPMKQKSKSFYKTTRTKSQNTILIAFWFTIWKIPEEASPVCWAPWGTTARNPLMLHTCGEIS